MRFILYQKKGIRSLSFALFGIGKMQDSIVRFSLDALLQPRRLEKYYK